VFGGITKVGVTIIKLKVYDIAIESTILLIVPVNMIKYDPASRLLIL
jgi:hypothetical protein